MTFKELAELVDFARAHRNHEFVVGKWVHGWRGGFNHRREGLNTQLWQGGGDHGQRRA
jgi:hypothetical protein